MSTARPLTDAERFARLRLARTDKVGPVTSKQLLDRFGSATRAIDALPDLIRRGGQGHSLPPVARIEAELEAGGRLGARLILLGDADYPSNLTAVDPPPPLLGPLATLR